MTTSVEQEEERKKEEEVTFFFLQWHPTRKTVSGFESVSKK